MMRNDERIKKDIVAHLYWDSRIDSSNIKVEVSDGLVTLSGTLLRLSICIAAVEDAEDVAGVRRVKNSLKVNIPETLEIPNDDEIKMIVENMLCWNPNIFSSDIDVSVVMGEVSLEGSVPSYWEKMNAEKIALEAAGTTIVSNKLTVVPTLSNTDKEIAENIMDALDRNMNVDADWVDVKVADGNVTLSGVVPDYRVYRAAYNMTAYTSGVLDINNDLLLSGNL